MQLLWDRCIEKLMKRQSFKIKRSNDGDSQGPGGVAGLELGMHIITSG